MRLNETVDELDRIKKKFADVDVKAEQLAKDLTIAKSDREWRFVRFSCVSNGSN